MFAFNPHQALAAGLTFFSTLEHEYKRSDDAGLQMETLVEAQLSGGIAVDRVAGHLYAGDGQFLFRTDLEGGNRVDLLAESFVADIELDLTHGKMYWSNTHQSTPAASRAILRANLDGSNVEAVINFNTLTFLVDGIAVDAASQRVYYSTSNGFGDDFLWAINGDGTNAMTLYEFTGGDNAANPQEIELGGDGNLYWIETGTQRIGRGSADGLGAVDYLIGGSGGLDSGLHVDSASGLIRFADGAQVFRMNLDGTNPQPLFTNPSGNVRHLEFAQTVPEPATWMISIAGLVAVGTFALVRRRFDRSRQECG